MQYQGRGTALTVSFEGDLRIDGLKEVVALALGEDLQLGLPRGLHEKLGSIAGDCQYKFRCELILPNIAVKNLGIDSDLLVLFRRLPQRSVRIKQVLPDVVDACKGFGVGKDHHAYSGLTLERNKRPESARAAVMPHNLMTIAGQDVPTEPNVQTG